MNQKLSKMEARECLSFHSCRNDNIEDYRWSSGFIGRLRPYTGLCEANLHEIMLCIFVLQDELQDSKLDQILISDLWNICHYGTDFGLDPNGMLQQNNILTAEETELLRKWIEIISCATSILLEGCDIETAYTMYLHYYPVECMRLYK